MLMAANRYVGRGDPPSQTHTHTQVKHMFSGCEVFACSTRWRSFCFQTKKNALAERFRLAERVCAEWVAVVWRKRENKPPEPPGIGSWTRDGRSWSNRSGGRRRPRLARKELVFLFDQIPGADDPSSLLEMMIDQPM